MNPLRSQFARLAFQVDRRILSIEEEAHYRVDFGAHEAVLLFEAPQAAQRMDLSWFKDYAFMATMLFSIMFMVSNAPAYAKLSMANLSQAHEQYLAQMEVESGVLIAHDAWTGEKVGETVTLLKAKESAQLAPEDGILAVAPTPSSLENRISIPSLNINAPMVEASLGLDSLKSEDWNELEEQIRESLRHGVVHYPGTANPGKKGNAFLTGHSSNVFWEASDYNTVFAQLPKIEVGAEILVTQNQREYTYVVTSKKEVSPKDVSVLTQGDGYQLTLMTCTPVGTTLNRLVVTAELKS